MTSLKSSNQNLHLQGSGSCFYNLLFKFFDIKCNQNVFLLYSVAERWGAHLIHFRFRDKLKSVGYNMLISRM